MVLDQYFFSFILKSIIVFHFELELQFWSRNLMRNTILNYEASWPKHLSLMSISIYVVLKNLVTYICIQIWTNQLLIFIEKLLRLPGFEPQTSRVPSRFATSWAIQAWIVLYLACLSLNRNILGQARFQMLTTSLFLFLLHLSILCFYHFFCSLSH